jgi:hypothetical protein
MMAAQLAVPASARVRTLTTLFDTFRPAPGLSGRPFDVSPIDGRFLMSQAQINGDTTAMRYTLVTNWGSSISREK